MQTQQTTCVEILEKNIAAAPGTGYKDVFSGGGAKTSNICMTGSNLIFVFEISFDDRAHRIG